jgi:hypothetical protein
MHEVGYATRHRHSSAAKWTSIPVLVTIGSGVLNSRWSSPSKWPRRTTDHAIVGAKSWVSWHNKRQTVAISRWLSAQRSSMFARGVCAPQAAEVTSVRWADLETFGDAMWHWYATVCPAPSVLYPSWSSIWPRMCFGLRYLKCFDLAGFGRTASRRKRYDALTLQMA